MPNEDSPAGRPVAPVLPVALLVVVVPSIAVVDATPIPLSISLRARSTLGKLKLLLPKGPTMPAEAPANSAGFRNAPRGSLSGFFEFSSKFLARNACSGTGLLKGGSGGGYSTMNRTVRKEKYRIITLDP